MFVSRQWIRLSFIATFACLLGACGASDGSDAGNTLGKDVAVSANPNPEDGAADREEFRLDSAASVAGSRAANEKLEPVARPGAGSPLDSVPDRVAKEAGKLSFATGFEKGVTLTPDPAHGNILYPQGADGSGFSFPVTLGASPSAQPTRVLADIGKGVPMHPSEYALATIKSVTGPDGSQTRALSLHSKAQSPRTSTQQISLGNSGLGQNPVVFQRMWIKFDETTFHRARQLGSERFYQTFWELRGGARFWLRLKIHYDAHDGLVFVAKADGAAGESPTWKTSIKGHSVVLAPASSALGWHKVEIWYDGASGRFKASVDGHPLVDRAEVKAADGSGVDEYRMVTVASTVAPLAEVLVDNLEFWTFPPEDAFSAGVRSGPN